MADKIVALTKAHDRSLFTCGNAILDRYFHQQVSQDIKAKVCTCFVLTEEKGNKVKGYYTLSSAAVARELVPPELQKKLPRYLELPVTLLGRLAVDSSFKRKGHGELLLLDALKKSFEVSQTSIGSMAVIVDPIDDSARKFYSNYGFILLPDSEKMFLPMKTIADMFQVKNKVLPRPNFCLR